MSPDLVLIIPLCVLGAVAAFAFQRRAGVAFGIGLFVIVAAALVVAITPDSWARTMLGTELTLTPLSRFLLVVTSALAATVTCISYAAGRKKHVEAVVLLVLAASVVASLSASEPVVSVFGLESAYLLVVFASGNRTVSGRGTVGGSSTVEGSRPEPGLEYVVMVSVSTVALVLAFTLMQSYTVTRDAAMLRLIVPLLGIGFGILLAAFPLHFWAPPLYHRATTQAIALVGAISTVQALGLLIQTLSRYPWLLLSNRGSDLLVLAGIASLVCCPLLSLWHRPLARSVAYLLAGNVGFIFVGLAIHSPSSISGAIWLCLTQAVAVLVVVIGLEELDASAYYSASERGSLPSWLGVAFVGVGVLAIVGVPVLGAFPGKWLLYNEAAAASPWLLAAMLAGSALTAAGLVRCLTVESRRRGTSETDGARLAKPLARPQLAAAVAAVLIAALVGLALYPDPLLTAIGAAVERLSLVL